MTMYTGGLNYQIEHHLLPCLPHMTMPMVSKALEPLCKKYEVNYALHNSPLEALKSHYALLKHYSVP